MATGCARWSRVAVCSQPQRHPNRFLRRRPDPLAVSGEVSCRNEAGFRGALVVRDSGCRYISGGKAKIAVAIADTPQAIARNSRRPKDVAEGIAMNTPVAPQSLTRSSSTCRPVVAPFTAASGTSRKAARLSITSAPGPASRLATPPIAAPMTSMRRGADRRAIIGGRAGDGGKIGPIDRRHRGQGRQRLPPDPSRPARRLPQRG